MNARTNVLADRVLVLQDQVDVLTKTYDPSQPRDEDGKWTDTGTNMSRRGFLGRALAAVAATQLPPQIPAKVMATADPLVASASQKYNLNFASDEYSGDWFEEMEGYTARQKKTLQEVGRALDDFKRMAAEETNDNVRGEMQDTEFWVEGEDGKSYYFDKTTGEFKRDLKVEAKEADQERKWQELEQARARETPEQRARALATARNALRAVSTATGAARAVSNFVGAQGKYTPNFETMRDVTPPKAKPLLLEHKPQVPMDVMQQRDELKLKKLAKRVGAASKKVDAAYAKAGFDPNEPRDVGGKWAATSGGGSGRHKGVDPKVYPVTANMINNDLSASYRRKFIAGWKTKSPAERAAIEAGNIQRVGRSLARTPWYEGFNATQGAGATVIGGKHTNVEVNIPLGTGDNLEHAARYFNAFDADIEAIAADHGGSLNAAGVGFGYRDMEFSIPHHQVTSFREAVQRFGQKKSLGNKIEVNDAGSDFSDYFWEHDKPSNENIKKFLERSVIVKGEIVKAGFDPNEPRDEKGRWSASGARGALKGASDWLSQSRVGQAAKAGNLGERAKDILAATAATIITSYNNNDDATEAVKQSILHASVGMKVTASEAREHVSRTFNRLRAMRRREKPDVSKAEDPVLELLTRIINDLDALELEDA